MKAAVLVTFFTLAACQNMQAVDSKIESTSFETSYMELGQEIAETHCSACHNVTQTGASPRADAPPLRTVLGHYNPTALADDFREHIHVGHPDMPDFDFSVKETEGLLEYLDSIQETSE